MPPDFSEIKKKIDDRLTCLVKDVSPTFLRESTMYALFSGGKRLRPLMTMTTARAYGIKDEDCLDAAAAIEFMHTYSLIHDDLPSMDNDDLRRGKPSLHQVFQEGHALLTGDFLLTLSFSVLANSPSFSSDRTLRLIQILSHWASDQGLIGGQILDITQPDATSQETLYYLKTGTLFTCALELGFEIAGGPPQDRECYLQIGKRLGISYQLLDNLDDSEDSFPEKTMIQLQTDFHEVKKNIDRLSVPQPFLTYFLQDLQQRMLTCSEQRKRPRLKA